MYAVTTWGAILGVLIVIGLIVTMVVRENREKKARRYQEYLDSRVQPHRPK